MKILLFIIFLITPNISMSENKIYDLVYEYGANGDKYDQKYKSIIKYLSRKRKISLKVHHYIYYDGINYYIYSLSLTRTKPPKDNQTIKNRSIVLPAKEVDLLIQNN